MKKLGILVLVAMIGVTFSSCKKETPQSVAEKFLSAYVKADFETAKTVATGDALDQINQLVNLVSTNPEFFPSNLSYENLNCQEMGGRVKCTYTMVEADQRTEGYYIDLEKVNGKWMITALGYEGEEMPEMIEEELPTDTTAVDELAEEMTEEASEQI
ncbi:MAG: hypothetical protein WBL11_04795 [Bacteroidales bacterium]|jgi:hypothetical protein|nr:hypothetical protein [Bacteroidales bacterium]MDI9575216.1 hypothetical protein [Bacteroidota bacterium]MDD2593796.1 hypothetical protein [Bacteroidales bacterium]MDD3756374.1 hypothetical protein [Bacteroidales bacterium]MDY0401590.1 hypothetical protein [Bacteroidales bacterium]